MTFRRSLQGASFCRFDGCELAHDTDALGRLELRCVGCERRRDHRCLDCGIPTTGRSWRCETHKATAMAHSWKASSLRNRDHKRRQERERLRSLTGEARRARLAAKKRWREANPMKVILGTRRFRLRQRAA